MAVTRSLRFTNHVIDKFWRARVEVAGLTVTFGAAGTAGKSRTVKLRSPAEAKAEMERLAGERIKLGYEDEKAREAERRGREGKADAMGASVPRLSIVKLKRVGKPIRKLVSKLGGQPVWVGNAEWPISKRWKTPMRFIGQVTLEPAVFGKMKARMAYLFATAFEWPIAGQYFETDACFADKGENAVVIQPGGTRAGFETEALEEGPTLYDERGCPSEFEIVTKRGTDPAFVPERKREEDDDGYFDAVYGDKIGGTPAFFQGDQWPRPARAGEWQLLLQLSLGIRREFVLNIPTMLFAFVSRDGKRGAVLAQH
ncbi:MAG TPA: WGR domain-containing protein [Tepidisphaeraceae bacterium]|nr:WGR domain-containing protein [Tepidisphaeraceae bacterium]